VTNKRAKQGWPWIKEINPEIYEKKDFWPRISIVTPSYNQGEYIEETILSVLNQNYPNLEYIVIDGGSTDNTIDIIKKYQNKITYWISEKDKGQSDAINKGLQKCSGQIFNFINSDDYLEKMSLYNIAINFDFQKYDIYAGVVRNFWDGSDIERLYLNKNLNLNNILRVIRDNKVNFHQPGVWLSMDKVKKVGYFNIKSHYTFDLEYLMTYLIYFKRVKYDYSTILVNFRYHDTSKSISLGEKFKNDHINTYKSIYKKLKAEKNILKFKAFRKYKTSKWDILLANYMKSSKKNKTSFLVKKILFDPLNKVTRTSLLILKNLISNKSPK
jgi:glycosyltransferase involved in cell wall biosynthesis